MSSLTRREMLTLSGVVVAGATASVVLQRTAPLGRDISDNPAVTDILNDDDWPTFGPAGADLTIVTFTDYQCPACRYAAPRLDEAIATDGKIRLVYRDWPIFGQRSEEAAKAAIASHMQGRYLAMHNALMTSRAPLTTENIMHLADAVGVDVAKLSQDLTAHAGVIAQSLARSRSDAVRLHLPGTPGYLIGRILVIGALQTEEFASVMSDARQP